jgi:hypothetical protein
MTRISIAYRNTGYIAEQIFPNVPVQKMSDKFFVFTKADWFRDEAGPRNPGTIGPQAGYSISSSAYSAQPISITTVLPDEVLRNADAPLNMQRSSVEFVTDKVLLAIERDVASLTFDNGSWSASATPSTTWDDDASKPLKDIEIGYNAVVKSIGRRPNKFVMGRDVWTKLKNHPDLLERIKYTQKGVMTEDLLAGLIGVDQVLIGEAVWTDTLEGETISEAFVWPNNAALLWVPPSPGLMVPAAGYTFTFMQRTIESHRRAEAKATAYRAEQHYDTKIVAPDAGYEFINAVA